jgi:hypothetical protein
MVEARLQHFGRGAVGLDLVAQHDGKIGLVKVIVQTSEGYGKTGGQAKYQNRQHDTHCA